MRGVLVLALLAGPAVAQDLTFSPAATESCLAATQDYDARHSCVGASAQACMRDTPGGDATCDYDYSQWGGGTGGGPAIAGCMMRMTGEQAIYLRASRLGG